MAGSITSANAVITLAVTGVFPPQQLKQFSADDIFDVDDIEAAETSMGVDGVLSGGFVNVPFKHSISFQANSDSPLLFDQWYNASKTAQDILRSNCVIILPAIGRKWSLGRGILTGYKPIPGAGKTLKPRKFTITWESMQPSPL